MLALLANSVWLMPVSIILAGFVGSAHCIGMCGPLALSVAKRPLSLFAYHLARIFAYIAAGTVAGGIGRQLTALAPPWLLVVVMISMSVLLITLGIRQYELRPLHFRMPHFANRVVLKLWPKAISIKAHFPTLSAAMLGAFSVLLPCGHLYAFLAGAVSTRSAVSGGVLMAAFALGTLPALAFGVAFVQKTFSPLTRSRFAGVCLIVAGLSSLGHFAWNWHSSEALREASVLSHTRSFICH